MALRKRRPADAEINVGPFSDIAFLLIIFFILTSTLTRLAGNKLDIPSARESKTPSKVDQPTVTLTGDRILWGGGSDQISMDELRLKLLDLDLPARPAGRRIVVINSAPGVVYQRYYEVMMAVNDAGGVLGIIAEAGESGKDED